MEDEDARLGYLGGYAVTIAPPPQTDPGGWFVTVAQWDQAAETYVSSVEGPILETREEALAEAGKALDWLEQQSGADNLLEVWEQMQRALNRNEPWAGKGERPRLYPFV